MGKWSELKGQYPDLPVEASFGERLGARLRQLETLPVDELIDAYERAQTAKAEAKLAAEAANFEVEATERALDAHLQSHRLDSVSSGGYTYTPNVEPYPQIVDRQSFLDWFKAHMPEVVREEVAWQTLKGTVKRQIESGEDIPAGVSIFLKKTFSRRKA